MGIIAWIVLGLGAGLLANMLVPGRRSQGLILTCLIGVAGALRGGWAATELFHVHTLHGFFNLSTWLTAIAGAAVLLLVFHLFSTRGTTRGTARGRRRSGWAHPVTAGVGARAREEAIRLSQGTAPSGRCPGRRGWGTVRESPDGIGATESGGIFA